MLQPLLGGTVTSFAQLLEQDHQAETLADLMDTEQTLVTFTRELGRRMCQAFAPIVASLTRASYHWACHR